VVLLKIGAFVHVKTELEIISRLDQQYVFLAKRAK
jgi:hypothetical protein